MKKQYWQSLKRPAKQDLADRLETSVGYLRHIFMHDKPAGAKLSLEIERVTSGKVTAAELRPDLFGLVFNKSA